MERREFLKEIQHCRRKLNLALCLKLLVFALAVGAAVGILFQVIALLLPFYYVNHYCVAAVVLGVTVALAASYLKRATMKQTALVMDSFGFQERIVTAYEHLDEDGRLLELQRADAMRQLQAHKESVRIPIMPPGKKLVGTLVLFGIMIGLAFVPAKTKEQAIQLHQVQEEAGEKEKEIEEVMEGLEELEKQETLTPEQLAELQEMLESLQTSMTEYQQAISQEMLATANEKLEYKYGDMSSQLANLAASLKNGATASTTTAEAMQNMANQLQQMSSNQSLASNQGSNVGQDGQDSQNGQSGSEQNSGQNSGQNGQSGTGQSSGQNGQSGNGQGSGQSGQSGQNGQSGQGDGQGSGNGSGSGSGSGNGSDSGRGEGSSNNTHDYVSIPNAIMDSGNLTGTAQNHEDSDFFRTQNGLAWEGNHVSYDTVIGAYEQNAYEGISTGQYPSGMENVIKDYFASFN